MTLKRSPGMVKRMENRFPVDAVSLGVTARVFANLFRFGLYENQKNRWKSPDQPVPVGYYSTVTDFARLRGWSTLQPRITAMWYESNCSGMVARSGDSISSVSGISM